MRTIVWIGAGLVGGLLGGMGLGGGTLLLPILTLIAGVPPKLAIWVNLFSFLPTAAVSLAIHVKNKMVDKEAVRFLLFFATMGVLSALPFLSRLSERLTGKLFGWFLIVLGSMSIILLLFGYIKEKR